NQLNSAAINLPDFLDNQHVIETAEDAEAYLARVSAFARALDQETETGVADAGRGAAPPDFIIDRTLEQLRGMRATPAAESTLATSIRRRAAEAGLDGDWAERATRLVETEVYPALERQIAALEAMRPTA